MRKRQSQSGTKRQLRIFKEETVEGELKIGKQKEEIEERQEKQKERIHAATMKRSIKIRRKELWHKDWWDRSCTEIKQDDRSEKDFMELLKGEEAQLVYTQERREEKR